MRDNQETVRKDNEKEPAWAARDGMAGIHADLYKEVKMKHWEGQKMRTEQITGVKEVFIIFHR